MNGQVRMLLLVGMVALGAACSTTSSPVTAPATPPESPTLSATDTPTAALASATPVATSTPGAADRAGAEAAGLDLIDRVVTLLFLDPQTASVVPLNSAALLTAAYERLTNTPLRLLGAPPPPPTPAFTGDPASDLALFRAAYPALLAGAIPSADRVALVRAAIGALVDRANAPYVAAADPYAAAINGPCLVIEISTAEQNAGANAANSGPRLYVGLGLQIWPDGQGFALRGIDLGGPAARAGLARGDAILAVDGVPLSGFSSSRVLERLRGAAGSPVTLTILRSGEATARDVVVTRAVLPIPRVNASVAGSAGGHKVGLLQLAPRIDAGVGPELRQALAAFESQGVDAWVLDLRDVAGGTYATLQEVAGAFVPAGKTIASRLERSGARRAFTSQPAHYVTPQHPLAVLVDSTTEGVGEVLAATLQEYGIGRVFGQSTAGCVTSGVTAPLPDGSSLWTVMSYQLTGGGRNVQGDGVRPDEVVTPDRSWVTDPPLDAALAWLATQP